MKEKINLGAVEETLLIPLYMRSKESQRENAIIQDEVACEIVSKIEYDFSKYDKVWKSELMSALRANHFDNKVREFISKAKNPIVVNLGCGLDTRYQRVLNRDQAIFYEIDFPDVITLRKKLIPETVNDINISSSMLETKWMDDLKVKHPEGNFIFIIEGVMVFLYENDIKTFLENLAARFSGSEVHFDVCGSIFMKIGAKNAAAKKIASIFVSAINDGKTITKWVPSMQIIEEVNYFKLSPKRWGSFGFFMRLVPFFTRRISQILGFVIR